MTQTSLFGADEVIGAPKLTDRQEFALAALRRHREGLTAVELGALLHERKGVHADWQRCEWCSGDGGGMVKSLRKKGLVRKRKDGTWSAAAGEPEPSSQGTEIPF